MVRCPLGFDVPPSQGLCLAISRPLQGSQKLDDCRIESEFEWPTNLSRFFGGQRDSPDTVEPEAADETELSVDELEVSQRAGVWTYTLGKGLSKQTDNPVVYYEGRSISVRVLHNKMGAYESVFPISLP